MTFADFRKYVRPIFENVSDGVFPAFDVFQFMVLFERVAFVAVFNVIISELWSNFFIAKCVVLGNFAGEAFAVY